VFGFPLVTLGTRGFALGLVALVIAFAFIVLLVILANIFLVGRGLLLCGIFFAFRLFAFRLFSGGAVGFPIVGWRTRGGWLWRFGIVINPHVVAPLKKPPEGGSLFGGYRVMRLRGSKLFDWV
jgi:hypothetical protein